MRLIDADAFKKQVVAMTIKENYSVGKANAMMKLIDMQPTAFDKEKVIEQIKNERDEAKEYKQESAMIAHEIDIEIVEKGGIDTVN